MPDLLGVTNPVPGLDNANINQQNLLNVPNDPRLQNAPDLDRVSRGDNRTEQQDAGDAANSERLLRYDSNFSSFLQRLHDTPGLVETMTTLLRSFQGTVVASGMGEGIALDMATLLEMLKMDGGELQTFFRDQMDTGNRFTGPFFNILREVYSGSSSEVLRGSILQFLKRYSDFSSTDHIQGNLLRNLTRITRSIPASYGNQLLPMAADLEGRLNAGDRQGALKLLQNSILPFLAGYTSRTNDMGLSRTLISMLALDVARYENSSEDGLLQAFRQLMAHTSVRERLGDLSDEALLRLLRFSSFQQAPEAVRSDAEQTDVAGKLEFADQLVKTIQRGLRGGSGAEIQDAFRNILSSFLLNQSVYMGLNHLIIPLEWNDRLMFSEMWVDPDAEENLKKGRGQRDNTIRFLFKMDIQNLGFFDMVMACQGSNVDLQLFCPETVAPFSAIVQAELTRILSENDLNPNSVQVQLMQQPLTLSAVFPKIFQGGSGIDVKA